MFLSVVALSLLSPFSSLPSIFLLLQHCNFNLSNVFTYVHFSDLILVPFFGHNYFAANAQKNALRIVFYVFSMLSFAFGLTTNRP